MDTKANLANRKKINELAVQHNKLTTLVACLLNELTSVKKELQSLRNGDAPSNSSGTSNNRQSHHETISNNGGRQVNPNKFSNFNDLRAEDILKQLSINSLDN
jgi:hypothetical protein